jgi:hypothetical protein
MRIEVGEGKGGTMRVAWVDRGREPQCLPNPAYPNGIDVDCSGGAAATCETPLPYPAKRCGHFIVHCETCGQTIVVTTAGRPDDPRSVKMACQISDKTKAH